MTKTAKDILGLNDIRGNALQPNIEPNILNGNYGRGAVDFRANKIDCPSCGLNSLLHTKPFYEPRTV